MRIMIYNTYKVEWYPPIYNHLFYVILDKDNQATVISAYNYNFKTNLITEKKT